LPAIPDTLTRVPLFTKGFRDRYKRADHFQKHRNCCGGATDEVDYERRADRFLGGIQTIAIQQTVRPSGDVVRYDVASGEFGCLSPDGYIRTYKIFSDAIKGLGYFQRQIGRTKFP